MDAMSAHIESARSRPPAPELDEKTLERCKGGDRMACRAFVVRYERLVFAFLSRALGRDDHVLDLATRTFLRALRAIPGFDSSGSMKLSTWVLSIAARQAKEHGRTDGEGDLQLPHILCNMHGFSVSDAAFALDLPEAAVKAKLPQDRERTPTDAADPVLAPPHEFAERVLREWSRERPSGRLPTASPTAMDSREPHLGPAGPRDGGASTRRAARFRMAVGLLSIAAAVTVFLRLSAKADRASADGNEVKTRLNAVNVQELRANLEATEKRRLALESELAKAERAAVASGLPVVMVPDPYDPTPEDWQTLAREGRFVARVPCVDVSGWAPAPADLARLGLGPAEGATVRAASMRWSQAFWETSVRPLCAEVIGSSVLADKLGVDACQSVVLRAEEEVAPGRLLPSPAQSVAEMRAGQRPVPAPSDPASPAERLLLALSSALHGFEGELAASFGPKEAARLVRNRAMCSRAIALP
jgi:DNA-directed RNA polymerase specialized sigma24 family protein